MAWPQTGLLADCGPLLGGRCRAPSRASRIEEVQIAGPHLGRVLQAARGNRPLGADQIIQNLEEFGSDYFAMAVVTGALACATAEGLNHQVASDTLP